MNTHQNMTQPIGECEDYICPVCEGVYTGDDWRDTAGGELICPECDDAKEGMNK